MTVSVSVRAMRAAKIGSVRPMPESSQSAASPTLRPSAAPYHHHYSDVPGSTRPSIVFFMTAVSFFALGVGVLPFAARDIAQYFYQPVPLAVVHTFTLGWITAAIMGVMYRYVPALTRVPLRSQRMVWVQMALFVVGASGMVTHFAIGIWPGLWLAAIVMFASVVLFAANLFPCLWRHLGDGVAETGMFLAIAFLVAAGLLGMLLGMDKTFDFMGGSLLTNLSAHVHLAAVGWVTISICAVSYRMLPAFLLPTVTLPPASKWQIYALSAATAALVASLLARSPVAPLFAVAIAGSIAWYAAIIGRMVRSRRMPLDWTPLHALAGVASLVAAIALGIALSISGGDTPWGARIAPAYGVMGLLGFFSNFIIGMSYQLFAGFVVRARAAAGLPPATIAEVSIAKPRLFVFGAFNIGVAALAMGFLVGWDGVAEAGALLVAAAGIVYSAATFRTLSYAFRQALPAAARNASLRVLPG